jgi:hypothetical protein
VRWLPITPVRLIGSGYSWLRDGIRDTGAEDTIFDQWVAAMAGIDLTPAHERLVRLIGRKPVLCKFIGVDLRITDGANETYEWSATVGFAAVPLRWALLGHAGFLQFFDADFRGADLEVMLTPNRTFAGRRI